MKEAFEKLKERLEEERVDAEKELLRLRIGDYALSCQFDRADMEERTAEAMARAIQIVDKVEAEYINKSTEHINKSGDCSTDWIPVEERLPETDDDVLIYYQYKIMQGVNVVGREETQGVGYYYSPSNDWIFYGGFGLDRHAIAWMPLPEPYRRKEQG